MSSLIDITINSGGIGGKAQVAPTIARHENNCLFTGTKCFFGAVLSARPYRWPKKIIRGIIYVGVNTLSKQYKICNTER